MTVNIPPSYSKLVLYPSLTDIDSQFHIPSDDPEEMKRIIFNSKRKGSISTHVIELSLNHILLSLTHIINYSFECNNAPNQWKLVLENPPFILNDLCRICL